MIILKSILLTLVVLFVLLLALLLFNKYGKEESLERFRRIQNATFYCFFMFVFLTLYILVIMVWESMNALISAGILAVIVWGANKFSCWCLEEKYIELPERKLLVAIAVFAISLIFYLLAVIKQEERFCEYAGVDLAIIVGFFVSLDALVGEKTFCGLFHKIWDDSEIKKARKSAVVIPAAVFLVVIIGGLIVSTKIQNEVQNQIDKGIAVGAILFIFIMLGVLKNKKICALVQNIFFKK